MERNLVENFLRKIIEFELYLSDYLKKDYLQQPSVINERNIEEPDYGNL